MTNSVYFLHRYRYDSDMKIMEKFPPPAELSLLGAAYQLHGVVEHHGTGRTAGHYTAAVAKSNKWWLYDDEKVDMPVRPW